tara:strand:+ start:328 stop:657 length:330 start_codon:yes stop_codon:yes gene_type:complete
MSNEIDRARKSLEISGYVHPDTINSEINPYKSYSEESKNVYVSSNDDVYSKFEEKNNDSKQQSFFCAKCNKKASYQCPCTVGEMMCENNHMWYVENDGKVIFGDPHDKE